MKISVFGLGYVGCVTSLCLADLGHTVIGVDIKKEKVDQLNNGSLPIYEKGLKEILERPGVQKRVSFTTDAEKAVKLTDISIICVGTPSDPTGKVNTTYVEKVAGEIAGFLKKKKAYHLIVIRSTIFPGLIHENIIPRIEKNAQKKIFQDIGLCMNPEFLREGSAIDDFIDPHKIIIGGDDEKSINGLKELYQSCKIFPDEIIYTMSLKQAQLVKYVDNIFHALKVVFANEIGTIAHNLDIDSHQVMNIFCKDKKLNLSPYYFRPGFAYGGSCLPKDLRAFLYYTRSHHFSLPLIESIQESNEEHINRATELIQKQQKKRIGFLGVTFKSDTDDVRENPIFPLIGNLIQRGYIPLWKKGYDIWLFDEKIGADEVKRIIPQYAELFAASAKDFLCSIDLLVICNNQKESMLVEDAEKKGINILDLQGIVSKKKKDINIKRLC
jgi:GDP-mannose 6-dehydrogenase